MRPLHRLLYTPHQATVDGRERTARIVEAEGVVALDGLLAEAGEAESYDRAEREAIGGEIPNGSRNVMLTQIAGRLRRAGLAEAEILGALRESNRTRCLPSLPDREVAAIAKSVAKYPPGVPEAPSEPPRVWTLADVVQDWRSEGTLVHEPTGLVGVDSVTDGGPVYGSRWYLLGAPDAGKTALLVQLAHVWAMAGVLVGLHAVDEEPSDLTTRFAQRIGFARRDCEARAGETLGKLTLQLPAIRLYGPEWTIEAATADLASAANGKRTAYLVDSIQGVTSAREAKATSLHQAVTTRVAAVRVAATSHRMITVATCEMNRGAYRTVEASDAAREAGDLASAKESGAVEYSARVMLALRSVKGAADRIEVHVAKNKHGPRGGLQLYLALDRHRMVLTDADAPDAPDESDRKVSEARGRLLEVAAAVVEVLSAQPGIGTVKLRAAVRAKLGHCTDGDTDAAVELLGRAVTCTPGKRGALHHTLDVSAVPPDVPSKGGVS